jgi:hypothetical protein
MTVAPRLTCLRFGPRRSALLGLSKDREVATPPRPVRREPESTTTRVASVAFCTLDV